MGAGPGPAWPGGYKPAENRESACMCVPGLEDPGPLPLGSQNPAASPRVLLGVWTPRPRYKCSVPSLRTLGWPRGPPAPRCESCTHTRRDMDTVTHVCTGSGREGEERMTQNPRKPSPGRGWAVNRRLATPERGLAAVRTKGHGIRKGWWKLKMQ